MKKIFMLLLVLSTLSLVACNKNTKETTKESKAETKPTSTEVKKETKIETKQETKKETVDEGKIVFEEYDKKLDSEMELKKQIFFGKVKVLSREEYAKKQGSEPYEGEGPFTILKLDRKHTIMGIIANSEPAGDFTYRDYIVIGTNESDVNNLKKYIDKEIIFSIAQVNMHIIMKDVASANRDRNYFTSPEINDAIIGQTDLLSQENVLKLKEKVAEYSSYKNSVSRLYRTFRSNNPMKTIFYTLTFNEDNTAIYKSEAMALPEPSYTNFKIIFDEEKSNRNILFFRLDSGEGNDDLMNFEYTPHSEVMLQINEGFDTAYWFAEKNN